jgi:hypothetical protein
MIELKLDLRFCDNLTRQLHSYFPKEFLNYLKFDYDQYIKSNDASTININIINSTIFLQYPISSGNGERRSSLKREYDLMFSTFQHYDENPFEMKLENICTHLANELIDNCLINPRDHIIICELLSRTIRDHLDNIKN